jgi:DNA-binding response OmpR family regulator
MVGAVAIGHVALRMVYELKPDLVLLDLALPDQSGTESCNI